MFAFKGILNPFSTIGTATNPAPPTCGDVQVLPAQTIAPQNDLKEPPPNSHQAEAARLRGVSRQAIARLIKKGRFQVLIAMKVLPFVPGHFTLAEWAVLLLWIILGLASGLTGRKASHQPNLDNAATKQTSELR